LILIFATAVALALATPGIGRATTIGNGFHN